MAAGDYPVRDATGAIIPLSPPYVSRFDAQRIPQPRARAAIIGTSITEMMSYRIGNGPAVDNGDGTWTVPFVATPRPSFAEGDIVKTTQGPVGYNSFKSTVVAVTVSPHTVTVRPDLNYPINLVGVSTPFIYCMNERQKNGYASHAEVLGRGAFEIVIDAGIGGGDTGNMNYSFPKAIASRASEFDLVIAEMGTMNDVYSRNWTYAQCIAQCKILIDNIASLGKPFLIIGCAPRDSANGAWTTDKLTRVIQVNEWVQNYTRSAGGSFHNPYRATRGAVSYLDPADANADPTAGMTDDQVHPNQRGGYVIGTFIAKWVSLLFPPVDILPGPARELDMGMLNTNPLMQGSGGLNSANGTGASVTGTVADDVAVFVQAGSANLTIVNSVVARTEALDGDCLGNNQRVTIALTSGTAIIEIRFGNVSKHAQCANGDAIDAICGVHISKRTTPGVGDPVGLRNASLVMNLQTNTTLNHFFSNLSQGSSAVETQELLGVYGVKGMIPAPVGVHGTPALVRASLYLVVTSGCDICVDLGRCAIYKNRQPFVPV